MTRAPALPAGHRAATCPRCAGAFACGVDADRTTPCACVGLALDDRLRARLRGRYEGCLCIACLAELARAPEACE